MLEKFKEILRLPHEISHLVQCINCNAEEVVHQAKSNGVILDKLKKELSDASSYTAMRLKD